MYIYGKIIHNILNLGYKTINCRVGINSRLYETVERITNYIHILEIFILLNINNTLKKFINLFEQARNLIDKNKKGEILLHSKYKIE